MSPDLTSASRGGLAALAVALIAACGLAWYSWSDQPEVDERLAAAQSAAKSIKGSEPLRERVERQRVANTELRGNIAELKKAAGFTVEPRFQVPPNEREPGKFFLNRFVEVRQVLREKAQARRIDSDERLGFPPDDRVPPDGDAPRLLAMLQLTEKAIGIVLEAPDPVEWFDISHDKPYETGPLNRPVLLSEYPLTLKLRGSLKTVLWILHRYGQRRPDDYPLILRGLSIKSDNSKVKDDVQQLEAVFQLAGMQFVPDDKREGGTITTSSAPGGGSSGMRARP
ncbi:MAG TPA: hypothetical protein DCS97_01850 [Planctomycetes bacterium]|nr:hypothetical protein [Planctomycetota bacterium]